VVRKSVETIAAAIQLNMAKPRIIVVGSSNTDMIIKVDRLPQAGETILGGEFHQRLGRQRGLTRPLARPARVGR